MSCFASDEAPRDLPQEFRAALQLRERRHRGVRGIRRAALRLLAPPRRVTVQEVVLVLEGEPEVEGEATQRLHGLRVSAAGESAHGRRRHEEVRRLVLVDESDVKARSTFPVPRFPFP